MSLNKNSNKKVDAFFANEFKYEDILNWAQVNIIDIPLSQRFKSKFNDEGSALEWKRLVQEWSMASDARFRACATLRPKSEGVRIGVKDTVDVVGFPTSLGLQRYRHYPKLTAPILRPMTANICAKLVTTELNIGIGSGCLNPYFPEVDPAGSSTGCGVAVAAGIVDIAFGTDVLGSVRWPAGRCGVVGLRTTHGAHSTTGIFPLSPSMDAPGWVARTADDLAFAWRELKLGKITRKKNLRIGIVREAQDSCQCSMITSQLEHIAQILSSANHSVVDVRIGEIWDWRSAAWEMCGYDLWQGCQNWRDRFNSELSEASKESIAVGQAVGDKRYQLIAAKQRKFRTTNLLGEVDAWLLPLDPHLPRKIGTYPAITSTIPNAAKEADERRIGYTPLASFAGLPAITFPASEASGIPIAMQLVGKPGGEMDLISLVQDVEGNNGKLKALLK